jgi:hypothetical protein
VDRVTSTFNPWDVVEELTSVADEKGTKRISMSQIGKELKDAEENNAENIQEVRRMLIELGYQIGTSSPRR